MSAASWITWAAILIAQNFSFTFVSRARNSGSLSRHTIAGLLSNGVWFASQAFMFSKVFAMMTGKEGALRAIETGVFYTVLTMAGSISAHWYALRSEKGKSAVGSNNKYAQITVEEWSRIKSMVDPGVS